MLVVSSFCASRLPSRNATRRMSATELLLRNSSSQRIKIHNTGIHYKSGYHDTKYKKRPYEYVKF